MISTGYFALLLPLDASDDTLVIVPSNSSPSIASNVIFAVCPSFTEVISSSSTLIDTVAFSSLAMENAAVSYALYCADVLLPSVDTLSEESLLPAALPESDEPDSDEPDAVPPVVPPVAVAPDSFTPDVLPDDAPRMI